jgi:hypothetical protein
VWPAVRWVPNSVAGAVRLGDLRCVLPPLDMPGCFGRRNCNVNLDDLRWDRPDLDCEPQQARGIRSNLQLDETLVRRRLIRTRRRAAGSVILSGSCKLHDTLIQVHSGAGTPNEISAIQILDVLLWMAFFRKR